MKVPKKNAGKLIKDRLALFPPVISHFADRLQYSGPAIFNLII